MHIDIDKTLEGKMGAKARYVPGWVRRWLKNLIHQDEINTIVEHAGDRQGADWIRFSLGELDVKVEVEGLENLPPASEANHYTFVSNHPLGGLDGLALGMILGEHFDGKIKFLVNDLLMNVEALAGFFVPVNITGRQSRNLPRKVDECFQGDNAVIMFPAGLCSRRINGVIHDLPWKKTFVVKSRQTGRSIVPIHFSGQNSPRFYRIAEWCKRLHIKFNLAMLYLPDEMFRNQHHTFRVHIGKPIAHSDLTTARTPQQWAQYIEEQAYSLPVE
ncbi:MAG: 1-acyl-sn-glycerol-3-phosphate acyltransferase [Alloprevotella sp.]|nr:1-acyl-sn-glycerol-3-phosphate acyltransferase [Alloprevotella sp.]